MTHEDAEPLGADATTRADESEQQPEPQPRRRHRRVVRNGSEHEAVSGLSADEGSTGWSETPGDVIDSNDARLTRDVPPHW
ncbi:hypothetical protein [Sanguibacter antarcticus]|uniref:Uncharacterized protein n=1 Tax=Sanguibacter antarcticus TaxID=372484 RepID=A0A2A9E147_9MICO|nr:hypothetical protein [Sanguibacter antarcticus]PFG32301.1 hypothetical protein ATL42_0122 [Sanguibacter antarcticus]